MELHEGQKFGGYRILRTLAQGGLATVYLAEDSRGEQVSLEVFPKQTEQENMPFLRDSRLFISLTHPHIVRTFDVNVEDDSPYIVTQPLRKGTLRYRHRDGPSVPLETVASYVNLVANALQYLHNRRIIHGDVKPDNMFVGDNGDILLGDFGIARLLKAEPASRVGTPTYMAPEVWRGQPSFASDQYSLAIVAYEWLCGTPPFSGNDHQLMYQHIYEQPAPLRSKNLYIRPAVEQVILRALAKDPKDRFASIEEFAEELQVAATPEPAVGTPVVAPYYVGEPIPPPKRSGILQGLGDLLGDLFSPREQRERQEPQDTQLKLFAIARTQLESDDRAFVDKTYFVEAGISQSRPEGFTGRRFTVNVQDPTAPIPFDIVVHAEKNIEFLSGWHQRLRYTPTNTEPQLIRFPFKVTAEGNVTLTVNFYREHQWLQTVELEFEGVDQSQLARTIYGREI